MMMMGSCSCLAALAVSLELKNSAEGKMGLGKKDTCQTKYGIVQYIAKKCTMFSITSHHLGD